MPSILNNLFLPLIFVKIVLTPNVLTYDVWNDIPCGEAYFPKNCDLNNISLLTVDDFDRCGPARLPLNARNYYLGASGCRDTYKENKLAYRKIKIIPKVLRDISRNTLQTTIMGSEIDFPIGLSPVGVQELASPGGELATVSGLSGLRTIMILSSSATSSIEDVAKRASGEPLILWMQTYFFRNRSLTMDIVQRAERNGFKAIVVTSDSNIDAIQTCDARIDLKLPEGVRLENLPEDSFNLTDPSGSFSDITWLKSVTSLPIVAKGILSEEDAIHAIEAGASAILVSNHGGRQMDGAPATIDVVGGIVDTLRRLYKHIEVYMDSGVRSGHDVFKAIAMGAKMVFVGRPTVWGLALNGSEGVRKMITILRNEFNETMLLSGNTNPANISRSSLRSQTSTICCLTNKC